MNITYDYYRIFYYVAKYKNFTQAARVLMNSQPNITRSMNNLENQLNCRLFIRSNKGVMLTPEGEKLYQHVSVAFEQLHHAELELSASGNLERGIITIGASETALHSFLLTRLNHFHQKYPGVRLRILNHTLPQALQALKNGEIDLAVVISSDNVGRNYTRIPLKYFQEIPLCSGMYSELTKGVHTLSELAEYPLICLSRGTGTFQFYSRLFLKYGLTLEPDMEVATTDLILPMIENHLGIGFVPEDFIHDTSQSRDLHVISLKDEIPERTICLIKEKGRPLNMAASHFEKYLTQFV